MAGFKDQDRIDELRKRLYERGRKEEKTERHNLSDEPVAVKTEWQDTRRQQSAPTRMPETPQPAPVAPITNETDMPKRKKRTYRVVAIAASLGILILALGYSSIFLFTGQNSISPQNIEVSVGGPFAVGGGEVLPLQIAITNQNTASIEAATLIMKYPIGTRSVDDSPRDIFEERLPLNSVGPGETINVPVRVAVFGEENDEKEVLATVEYRLVGSNGTFFKDAEPFVFKLNSAPITVSVESTEKLASGQETDVTLTIKSNAPNSLENILVSASYPNGFDFTSADPAPFYSQNAWLFDELAPEETKTITITGVVLGQTNEASVLRFTIGNPDDNNQFQMGSVLATADAEFLIERPFIDVRTSVNGDAADSVAIDPDSSANVTVRLTNTLDETVYDVVVEATLVGATVREDDVSVSDGFYNSLRNVVRWDVSSKESLAEFFPGANEQFSFNFQPIAQDNTPTFDIEVDVFARRVSDSSASEDLIGSSQVNARIETELALMREAGRNTSVFADQGPVPPVAEERTTYTLTLVAQNGSNDVVDAVVTTSVPQFINWPDNVSGEGSITYNPVSKAISWDIGSIAANETSRTSFQVELVPSLSQIGDTPVLLSEQRLRATDRFTGTVIRATAPPISAQLSDEAGFGRGSGEVQDPDN
ncbi:MAG: hypothetical protein AAGA35_02005 [Patescibacteria group bacterium]